jgi:hypothetical protein
MNNRLPPYPEQNLNSWARKLYEYLVANSPSKGTVDPTPLLLPHITANQTPRAVTPGVLMYDPTAGSVVVSDGSAFIPVGGGGVTLSGDVTGPSTATVLATVNADVGSFGLVGSVAKFTVNAKGLITAAVNEAISIAAAAISDATAAGKAMLTAADAAAQTALLDVFTSTDKGLVPASGGGTTNFLRADGTFAAPAAPATDSMIRLSANYTLANSTAVQKLFNESTNGAVTLETGQYEFECVLHITGMSGTNGNAAFSLAAGTATIDNATIAAVGRDANLAANAGSCETSFAMNALTTAASMVQANTGTQVGALLKGRFDISVAGTIIPSVALVTAIGTAAVQAGTYFHCRRIGDTGDNTIGTWS